MNCSRYLLIIFCLLWHIDKLSGYQTNIDSLQPIINSMPDDTQKVRYMLDLMHRYQYESKATGIELGQQVLPITRKINYFLGEAQAQEIIGRIFWSLGNYDSAIYYHLLSVEKFKKLNRWKDYWDVMVMLGQDYANSAQYDKAIPYLNKALQEYESKKVVGGVTYVLGILSWVYDAKGDYLTASKITLKQIEVSETSKDSQAMRVSYFSLANIYAKLNKYEEADQIIDSWYSMLKLNNNHIGLLDYYVQKATYAENRLRLDSAFFYYNKTKEIAELLDNIYWIAYTYWGMGKLCEQSGNCDNALTNFDSAYYYFKLSNQYKELMLVNCKRTLCLINTGNIRQAKKAIDEAKFYLNSYQSNRSALAYFEAKYKYDSAANDWLSAFKHLNLYEALKDSLFNDEAKQELLELQIRLETDKTEALLKSKNEKTKIYALVLLGLVLLVLTFYFQLYYKNQKIRMANRIQSAMLNEIHHRVKNNLQLISGFLQIQLGKTLDIKGRDAIEESINSIQVVSLVHENLYQHAHDLVLLKEYVPILCDNIISTIKITPKPEIQLHCEDILLHFDQTIPLGLILNELVTNSIKHAFNNAHQTHQQITINLSQVNNKVMLFYGDNGSGFISNHVKTNSIGLKLIKMLVQELQGNYEMKTELTFEFRLTFAVRGNITKHRNGAYK